ncbi:MAG: nitrate/nitrite transporter NrtS [Dermatophilaceae bacterium]
MNNTEPQLTWCCTSEALRVVVHRRNLTRTIVIALLVGSVLFAINQLDVVISGHADAGTWIKIGLTYLVPFCVANIGLLLGCRRRGEPEH